MRSLARDIRAGLKLSKYKIQHEFRDGKGGHCVMGAALLAVGVDEMLMNTKFYGLVWPAQQQAWITDEAVSKNNNTDLTREEIADIVEQMEWTQLGIPTEAMERELRKREATR